MYHKASKEPEARKGRLQRQRQPFLGDGSSAARREGDRSYTISRDIGFFAFKGQRKGFICHNIQIIPYFLESTENCIKSMEKLANSRIIWYIYSEGKRKKFFEQIFDFLLIFWRISV